jgi:hypothetical protein
VSTRSHACIARERRVGRYYDPATDQFLSVDPMVAATGEHYSFTGDDPVNATDPLGLMPTCGGQAGNCDEADGHPTLSTPSNPNAEVPVDPAGNEVPLSVVIPVRQGQIRGTALATTLESSDSAEYDYYQYLIDTDPLNPNEAEDPTLSPTAEPQPDPNDNPDLPGVHFGLGQILGSTRQAILCGINPAHSSATCTSPQVFVGGELVTESSTDPFIQAWMMQTYIQDTYGSDSIAWQVKQEQGTY